MTKNKQKMNMASTKDYNSFMSIHLKFKGRNTERCLFKIQEEMLDKS